MNTVLKQRKIRLAARLATDTAMTFGLLSVAAFTVLIVVSLIWREISGEYVQLASWVIFAIPLILAIQAWVHLTKSYPMALANGLTRREFLAAYALFALATVIATAALTQLGLAVIDLFSTFRGVAHHEGFYGMGLAESVVRPALFFAAGAAGGAITLRLGGRWLGAVVSAVTLSAVIFRELGYMAMAAVARGLPTKDGYNITFEIGDYLGTIDAVGTLVLALLVWALLARAPMRPKTA